MKLKIPPAAVMLFFGFLMWIIDRYLAPVFFEISLPNWISDIGIIIALAFGFFGLIEFYRHKTSVDPHKPDGASALVCSGIYKFSRNPMYVALLFLLAAFGLKLGNILVLAILPFFVLYMNRFQIIPEEEALLKKFGKEYETYSLCVRRWI